MFVGDACVGLYSCFVKGTVGLYTGNMDLIGITSCGDWLRIYVAELFARTSVGLVEKAGDAIRGGSGLAFGDLCM
jgi:hypothetical protein